jgi:hypothetical protein
MWKSSYPRLGDLREQQLARLVALDPAPARKIPACGSTSALSWLIGVLLTLKSTTAGAAWLSSFSLIVSRSR